MWVRSQNKATLEKVSSISIRAVLNDEKSVEGWSIMTMRPSTYTELGIYKTRERAIEVMDEIEIEIVNIEIRKLDSSYSIPNAVYQMPVG